MACFIVVSVDEDANKCGARVRDVEEICRSREGLGNDLVENVFFEVGLRRGWDSSHKALLTL